jgi:hypothetical protein
MVRRVDKERYNRATIVSRSIVNAEDEVRRAKTERLRAERLRLVANPTAPVSPSTTGARVERETKTYRG